MGIIDKVLAIGLDLHLTTPLNSNNLVEKALGWVGSIAGIVAFFYLIYGGFMYLTAAGNAEQSKKGGQTIMNAIIGLIIIALAWALISYVVTLLGGNVTP